MKVTYEHDKADDTQCIPGSVRLKFGVVRELGSIDPLYLHALVEANVSDTDSKPS